MFFYMYFTFCDKIALPPLCLLLLPDVSFPLDISSDVSFLLRSWTETAAAMDPVHVLATVAMSCAQTGGQSWPRPRPGSRGTGRPTSWQP